MTLIPPSDFGLTKMLDINSSGSACTTGSIIPFLVKSKISLLISMGTHKGIYGDEIVRLNETYTVS